MSPHTVLVTRRVPDPVLNGPGERASVVRGEDPALRQGTIGGAGLDVFEFEPQVPAELTALPNVVLSPHIGGTTAEARYCAWELCFENVLRVLQGMVPETPAFPLD